MAKKSVKKDDSPCSVSGCNKPHHARDYCQKHYDEYRKKNRKAQRSTTTSTRKLCSVPGCNRFHHARGYCKMHYAKLANAEESGGKPSKRSRTLSTDTPIALPSPEVDPKGFRSKRLLLIRQRHRRFLKKRRSKP